MSTYPNARHSIIAHSHGGNIALYSLAGLDTSKINKIICLNTPFINARRRSISSMVRGPLLGIILLASLIPYPLARSLLVSTPGDDLVVALLLETIAFISAFLCYLKLMATFDWSARTAGRRERAISPWAYPSHDRLVVCLWSASDEVADLFSFCDFTTNFPYLMLRLEVILVLWAAFGVAYGVGWLEAPSYSYQVPFFGYLLQLSHTAISRLFTAIYCGAIYIVTFVCIIEVYSITWGTVVRLALGIPLINPFTAHYIRVTAGLIPINSGYPQFEEFDLRFGLRHSAIYNNVDVATRIAELLLACSSTQNQSPGEEYSKCD